MRILHMLGRWRLHGTRWLCPAGCLVLTSAEVTGLHDAVAGAFAHGRQPGPRPARHVSLAA